MYLFIYLMCFYNNNCYNYNLLFIDCFNHIIKGRKNIRQPTLKIKESKRKIIQKLKDKRKKKKITHVFLLPPPLPPNNFYIITACTPMLHHNEEA